MVVLHGDVGLIPALMDIPAWTWESSTHNAGAVSCWVEIPGGRNRVVLLSTVVSDFSVVPLVPSKKEGFIPNMGYPLQRKRLGWLGANVQCNGLVARATERLKKHRKDHNKAKHKQTDAIKTQANRKATKQANLHFGLLLFASFSTSVKYVLEFTKCCKP